METLDKFIVYVEEIESLKELSNEEIGVFFRAVTEYVKSGIVPNLPERLIFPFRFITAHISRDQKKYKDISEKRKIAGKKGLDSRMKNSEGGLSEENKKCVRDAERWGGNTKQYVEDTEKCIEEAEKCVKDTEKYVEEAEKCVENVEQCVEDTEKRVEEAEKCIEDTEKYVEEAEKYVEDTEKCIEEAEKCVENVEQCVESINQDNGTNICERFDEYNGEDIGENFYKDIESIREDFDQDNGTSIRDAFDEDNGTSIRDAFDKDNGTKGEEDLKKTGGRNIKECFEEFWNAYPNKTGRNGAAVEYMCMFTGKKSHFEIMKVLNEFKKSEEWKKGDGTNVPPPQKWLSDLKKFGDKPFIFSSS